MIEICMDCHVYKYLSTVGSHLSGFHTGGGGGGGGGHTGITCQLGIRFGRIPGSSALST